MGMNNIYGGHALRTAFGIIIALLILLLAGGAGVQVYKGKGRVGA